MKVRKRMKSIFCGILAAALLVGCGSSGTTADTETTKTENSSTASEAPSVLISDGWTEADATETITYLRGETCNTLDPWSASPNTMMRVISYLIYDPLCIADEDGNIQPWLAESYEMSDDYMAVTFKLRDDVYFTNGEKLTADDVIFTFERIRDDESFTESDVQDWRPYIGELEKIDELTFTLNFAQPMPAFESQVINPELGIICKSAYEELGHDKYFEAPIGTGAYVVEEWDAVNTILKVKLREDEHGYWGYRYTGSGTNVKYIYVKESMEAATRVSALRNHEAQIIDDVSAEDSSVLAAEGFRLQEVTASRQEYILFNLNGIMGNRDLREAISLAMDRQLLLDTFHGGTGTAAVWFCREGDAGWGSYTEELGFKYDPEKAKELVEASGYNGEEIRFILDPQIPLSTEEGVALQAMWSDVGLNVKLEQLDYSVFMDRTTNADYDIRISGLICFGKAWYPNAVYARAYDLWNCGLEEGEFKDLNLQLASTANPEEYTKLYEEIYAQMAETYAPDMPVYFTSLIEGVDSGISGDLYHNMSVPDMHAIVYTP